MNAEPRPGDDSPNTSTRRRRRERPCAIGGVPWAVWVAVILAVAVRAAFITAYVGWNHPPGQDGRDYDALATNLVAGRGYALFPGQPSAWRPPGYPGLLAGIYLVAGHSYAAVRAVHCILGGALALLAFCLGRRLADQRVGIAVALVTAVYPLFVALSGFIYTESLYLPMVLGVALLFTSLQERPSLRRALGVGAAAGLTALVRPNLLALPVVGGMGLWASGVPLRRVVLLTGAMALGAALVVGPWTVRNWAALGELVPISTNGGVTLLIGNNRRASGGGRVEWAVVGYPPDEAEREYAALGVEAPRGNLPSGINYWEGLSEVENDRRYRDLARTWVREHPRQAVGLVPKKLAKFWSWRITSQREYTKRYAWVSLFSYGVMLPFSVLGFALSLRQWRGWLVAYVMAVPYIVAACVFYGSARLRLPVDCFLIVLAVYALARVHDWSARGFGQATSGTKSQEGGAEVGIAAALPPRETVADASPSGQDRDGGGRGRRGPPSGPY